MTRDSRLQLCLRTPDDIVRSWVGKPQSAAASSLRRKPQAPADGIVVEYVTVTMASRRAEPGSDPVRRPS